LRLTKEAVADKKFKRSFKGYDEYEVDEFLDYIVEELDLLEKKLSEKEAALDKYSEMQDALSNSILSAHKTADKLIMDSKLEADKIIEGAYEEAKRIKHSSEREATDLRKVKELELEDLQKRILSLKSFADNCINVINGVFDSQKQAFNHAFTDIDFPSNEMLDLFEEKQIDLADVYKEAPATDEELKEAIKDIL